MEPITAVFGQRLKALRKARGLTQEQLGQQAGMDYKHLGSLERGVDAPSLDAIERLAKVLNAEYFEFFLPERLTSGHIEQGLKELMKDPDRLDPTAVGQFFRDMATAIRKLEGTKPS